jgi:Uma2 family endonuclease
MISKPQATIHDLVRMPGKAELVAGEIVAISPTGVDPGYAGDEIFASLRQYVRQTGRGRAVGDNKGFHVNLPHRQSFSPDAAYYIGPTLRGMRFYEGAPVFAVEVRSENDYGPLVEATMAAKRADYFLAGTQVVWDVDLQSEETIKSYHVNNPDHPIIFRRGTIATAEPAVPDWTMPVDELFE